MARQSEKFGFMLKYSHPDWFREAVNNNHENLSHAKVDQVDERLKDLSTDELKYHTENHPSRVIRVLSRYQLQDRGVEGY